MHFQPVFTLHNKIQLSGSLLEDVMKENEYPLAVTMNLIGEGKDLSFDVQLVYDFWEG